MSSATHYRRAGSRLGSRLFHGWRMGAEFSRRRGLQPHWLRPALGAQQPGNSPGVSFNAVQNIDAKWGLFLRANGESGTAIPIETSVAWGGIRNNPFLRNKLDQVGFGVFWDKTNLKAVAQPAHHAEWGTELYHSYVLFKGLWFTPDVQIYFDPALHPGAGPAAVFTIRTTAFF